MRFQFQISVEVVQPFWFYKQFCISQLPVIICVNLIMVTIIRYIFTDISKFKHVSTIKFLMVYEKNMIRYFDIKISKRLKKLETIELL